jgi:hypothetical protein
MGAAYDTKSRTLNQCITAGDLAVNDTLVPFVVDDGAGNWEFSLFTITSATVITRTQILSSSNSGAAVTFSGASLTVYNTMPAAFLRRVPFDRDVTFSATIPLDVVGCAWMDPVTPTADIAFNPGLTLVKGAFATVRVTGDGTYNVTAPGFKAVGTSGTYDKTAGTVNIFEFMYDGVDCLYSVAARGNVAVGDSTPPALTSPTGTSTGTSTASGTVSTNEATGTLYYMASTNATETVATVKAALNQPVTASGVQNVTFSGLAANTTYYAHYVHRDAAGNDSSVANSSSFTTAASGDTTPPVLTNPVGTQTGPTTATATVSTNEATGTLYYMASTNSSESLATVKAAANQPVTATGTQSVSFSGLNANTQYYSHFVHRDAAGNDSAVANGPGFTTAAATVPAAPTIGPATFGDTTATATWTLPANTSGSPLTGNTVTAYNASTNAAVGTVTVAANATTGTVTGLTNGTAVYLKVASTNGVGTGNQSAASNTVTPNAVYWPKLLQTTNVQESGTGPYTYTGTGQALNASVNGGILSKSLAAGADGYLEFKVPNTGDIIVGLRAQNTQSNYNGDVVALFITPGNAYYKLINGVNSSLGVNMAAGDICRVTRVGTLHKLQKAPAANPTSFTDLYSYDYGSSPQMWFQVHAYETAAVQLTAAGGVS